MLFCKDCIFCDENNKGYNPLCKNHQAAKPEEIDTNYLVTGEVSAKETEYYYCATMRHNSSNCGQDANWFHRKDEPFPKTTPIKTTTIVDKIKTTLGII